MSIPAVVLNVGDNVAVALRDLETGTELDLRVDGRVIHVELTEPIAYQHKFSLTAIDAGSKITKYGETIGEATRDFKAGQDVHVHNMVGLRAKANG